MLDLEDDLIDNLDFQVIDLGSKTLLAFHGWYDYSYSDEKLDKILKRKKQLWFDRRLKRLGTDPEICQTSLKRLDNILSELDTNNPVSYTHLDVYKRQSISFTFLKSKMKS